MANPETLVGRYVIEHIGGSTLKGRVREHVRETLYLVAFVDHEGEEMLELYNLEDMMEWVFFESEHQRDHYLRSLDR